jgi:hypothetical protein
LSNNFSVNHNEHKFHHDHLHVNNHGTVIWLAKSQLHTTCAMDISTFPLDRQTCNIDVGVGLYSKLIVNLHNDTDGVTVITDCEMGDWTMVR